MNTDEPIPELTDRDKLFLLVLEELPPYLVDVLINIQRHQGRPMAGFLAEALSAKLDHLRRRSFSGSSGLRYASRLTSHALRSTGPRGRRSTSS
jgi:hypothetical protein